jgi:hypothetical protein
MGWPDASMAAAGAVEDAAAGSGPAAGDTDRGAGWAEGGSPAAGAAEAVGAGYGEPEEAAEGWLVVGAAGTRASGAAPEPCMPCTSITNAGEATPAACGAMFSCIKGSSSADAKSVDRYGKS